MHQIFSLEELLRKKCWSDKKGEDFIFPKADGTAKLSGRDYEFREPTVRPEPTVRTEDLWRNPRRIGRVPTGRTNRWRWSPCRFLVDPGRNISCSTDMYIYWYCWVYSYWSGCVTRETNLGSSKFCTSQTWLGIIKKRREARSRTINIWRQL